MMAGLQHSSIPPILRAASAGAAMLCGHFVSKPYMYQPVCFLIVEYVNSSMHSAEVFVSATYIY